MGQTRCDTHKTMLFKTISASMYGIDAYLVEVEVDVGSAGLQDFNVVGVPDNAVKESRGRIKSVLRNCRGLGKFRWDTTAYFSWANWRNFSGMRWRPI